jgi:hypothetical protein
VGRFARRVKAWATTTGVPVIYCKAGEGKHMIAKEHLAAHPPSRPGVFLVLAPARVWLQLSAFAVDHRLVVTVLGRD